MSNIIELNIEQLKLLYDTSSNPPKRYAFLYNSTVNGIDDQEVTLKDNSVRYLHLYDGLLVNLEGREATDGHKVLAQQIFIMADGDVWTIDPENEQVVPYEQLQQLLKDPNQVLQPTS